MPRTKKSKSKAKIKKGSGKKKGSNFLLFLARLRNFKVPYFNIGRKAATYFIIFVFGIIFGAYLPIRVHIINENLKNQGEHWLILERGSNKEFLYFGVPGDKENSELIKEFKVKSGIPGERPTPLPSYLGKKYWKIVKKYPSSENPETAPYFLELDIPVEDGFFGPVPYTECNGQCSWELPGYFGLHGINGDKQRLSVDNPGSSGCIRHTDEDIAYLYNLLDVDEGVRYYIYP